MKAYAVVMVAAAFAAAGCSARAVEEEGTESRLSRCELPDEHDLGHTGRHTVGGPFRNVTAAPPGSPTVADISRPHTIYRVTLSPAAGTGEEGRYEGVTTFVPRASGAYAVTRARRTLSSGCGAPRGTRRSRSRAR